MSKYAKINSENIVENIIVCQDSEIFTQNGYHVKVTSDTNNAEIGYEYSIEKNKFKPYKRYDSWTLNEDTFLWEAPVATPEDAIIGPYGSITNYFWDENSLSWVAIS